MPSVQGQPTFVGEEFLINDSTVEHKVHQLFPTQTVLGNWDILVAWETGGRFDDEHPATEIDARILNPDGTFKTPEFVLKTNGSLEGPLSIQTLPNGAGLVNGQFVVDAEGHVGPPPASVPASRPTLLSDGNVLVTSDEFDGTSLVIHGHIVDPKSRVAGPDFLIGSQIGLPGNESVTALADGRAIAVWEGEDGNIDARVINADGTTDDPFVVNSATDAAVRDPHVTELPSGEIFATWSSWHINPDGTGSDDGFDIHGRMLTLDHVIIGTAGNDVLNGGAENDDIYGDGGNDALTGAAGDDVISGGTGHNLLWGNDGNDTFLAGSGTDIIAGGAGSDTVLYEQSSAGVEINLATGTASGGDATGDTLNSIENITGSAHDDVLIGNAAANRLDGNDGDDLLSGGDGNDTLIGGHGADVLEGGAGIDTADYSRSQSGVTVDLMLGTGHGGDAEGDTLTSIENITGSAHDDHLIGNTAANLLFGGAGADVLTGGAGADTFIFKTIQDSLPGQQDQITDFSSLEHDHIDLSGIDANTQLAGDQAFGFIGSAAFSNVAGQLRYADHVLEGDVNGDGVADFSIHVNAANLQHGDLVL